MTEPPSDEGPETAPPGFLRRVIAPAVAIMILYASIRALPPLLMNRIPPIDGEDLFQVFLIALLFFWGLAAWFDYRAKQKGADRES